VKTSELTGNALDWAVAKCEVGADFIGEIDDPHFYSTDWAQGGPIIEREGISICNVDANSWGEGGWTASLGELWSPSEEGWISPTALVAAMRAYVARKLGEDVEVPAELNRGHK
jgi:hypothetical protein